MELNAEHVESLMEGLVAVPEDVFWAEMERRRAERRAAVRRSVQRAYYERNRDKIVEQQRDYRRRIKNQGVAPTPVQSV